MRLGIIARSDNTGLGNQTRELVKMLQPERIMLINSEPFNNNKQHPEWYKDYENIIHTSGFAKNNEIVNFIKDLDIVLSCETFYNPIFLDIATDYKVKTVLQYNYEFLDYLAKPNKRLPNILCAPSLWNFDKVDRLFGRKTKVVHLPPPTDHNLFEDVRNINLSKDHNRILHIAGKAAAKDRNGTETVIEMMKHSKADFELVIKTQSELKYGISDSRIKIEYDNPDDRQYLYSRFDAMILPRRYAGLCLPMNEALLSALPVFMTNISPNSSVLPGKWLADSHKIGELMTRTMLDVYEADPFNLATIVDNYINKKDKSEDKQESYSIGYKHFSPDVLKDKYLNLLQK